MAIESPIEYWNNLGIAADQGELFLDADAAVNCDKACNDYLITLRSLKNEAASFPRIEGMGTFDSGIKLAAKFSDKVSGGANNLVDVLQSHIDVVMAMQAVFRKFFDATEANDQDNASGIGHKGPK